jgi:hypothetical protein
VEKKTFLPMTIAVFIGAVGLVFLGAAFLDLPPLQVESPQNYVLAGVAIFFVLCGCGYGYFLATDTLQGEEVTVTEVRQQAIEKIQDQSLLAQMATEDPDGEVREAAQERLQEIAS